MKRLIFFYLDSAEYACWINESYRDHWHIEQREFAKGTSDWEIIEAARVEERIAVMLNVGCAGEQTFTRKLARIVEIARDLDLPAR